MGSLVAWLLCSGEVRLAFNAQLIKPLWPDWQSNKSSEIAVGLLLSPKKLHCDKCHGFPSSSSLRVVSKLVNNGFCHLPVASPRHLSRPRYYAPSRRDLYFRLININPPLLVQLDDYKRNNCLVIRVGNDQLFARNNNNNNNNKTLTASLERRSCLIAIRQSACTLSARPLFLESRNFKPTQLIA